jgi:Mrp family chromosome partitioning ATPase
MSVERFADPRTLRKAVFNDGRTQAEEGSPPSANSPELGSTAAQVFAKAWARRRMLAVIIGFSMLLVVGIESRRSVTYTAFATITLDIHPDFEQTRWVRIQGLLISTEDVRKRAEKRFSPLGEVKTESGGFFGDIVSVQGVGPTQEIATKTANAYAEAYNEFGRTLLATEIVANRRTAAGQQAIVRQRLRELEVAVANADDPFVRSRYQTEFESWLALQTRVNALGREVEARSRRVSDVKRIDLAFGAVPSQNIPLGQLVFMGLLVGCLLSAVFLSSVTAGGVAVTKIRELATLSRSNFAWAVPTDRAWSLRSSFRKRRPLRAASARPDSTDAIRSIRTALVSFPDLAGRVVLVTSPSRNEGKSVIALLLAQAIGKTGKSVLLVDAHLRAPRVHLLAGTRNVGVAELSAGSSNARRRTQRIEGSAPFDVLCAGLSSRPAEHVTEVITAEWIVRLLGKYEYIVIDGPPLLDAAETRLLANLADVVAIVARARRTTHDELRQSEELLDAILCERRLMVLNRTIPHPAGVIREVLRRRRPLRIERPRSPVSARANR